MMSLDSSVSAAGPQDEYCRPEPSRVYNVQLAECKTVGSPYILSTSLGSCVAVSLYDPVNRIGGMAHVMLPDSSRALKSIKLRPGRYADTAIKVLIEDMVKKGSSKKHIVAKIAGGARMLNHNGLTYVGDRNVDAVKEILEKEGIRLLGEDVNGTCGRRVEFYTDSGTMKVEKIMKHEEARLL